MEKRRRRRRTSLIKGWRIISSKEATPVAGKEIQLPRDISIPFPTPPTRRNFHTTHKLLIN
jgi:hypothetical protein